MSELGDWIDFLYSDQTGYVYAPVRKTPTDWVTKFFQYPQEKEQLASWITVWGQTADVFLAPSIFKDKSPVKKSVKGSSVVWAEFDGQTSLDLSQVPEPSAVIQSSKDNHFHIYWRIPFSPGEVVEDINRRLTYNLNADSSGWDSTQILRPPFTVNFKRHLPVLLKSMGGSTYDVSSFDSLPKVPLPPTAPGIESILDVHKVLALNKVPDKLWDLIENPKNEVGERSTYLMYLGYSLAEAGFGYEALISILLYADGKVGKFVGRTDQLQRLSEIASRAIHEKGSTDEPQEESYSYLQLLNDDASIDFHWEPFLPVLGRCLVTGSPGVGKTLFTTSLASHLSLGRDFLGFKISAPCRSLYVSLEMGKAGLKRAMLKQAGVFSEEELALIDKNFKWVPVGHQYEFSEIRKNIKKDRPDVLFLDSMFAISKGDLSGEEEPRRIFDWLDLFREEFGVATCLIHHNRKPSDGNKKPKSLADIYGNVMIQARIDTAMILWKNDTKQYIEVIPDKVRYDDIFPFNIVRDSKTLHYSLKDTPTQGSINVQSNSDPDDGPTGNIASGGLEF